MNGIELKSLKTDLYVLLMFCSIMIVLGVILICLNFNLLISIVGGIAIVGSLVCVIYVINEIRSINKGLEELDNINKRITN